MSEKQRGKRRRIAREEDEKVWKTKTALKVHLAVALFAFYSRVG